MFGNPVVLNTNYYKMARLAILSGILNNVTSVTQFVPGYGTPDWQVVDVKIAQ